MRQKNLSKWLKIITFITGLIGAIIYFLVIPVLGSDLIDISEKLDFSFWPWMIFVWGSAIPCYVALVFFYWICIEIGKDNSFSKLNAKLLKQISFLAIVDCIYFFSGECNLSFFKEWVILRIILFSLFIVFAGIAVAILAASFIAIWFLNAAEIKEENDLTVWEVEGLWQLK